MGVTRKRPNRNGSSVKNDREAMYIGTERTCPVCNTAFMCHMATWVYKLKKGAKVQYYCRYNCFRAAEKALEK